MSIDYTYFGLDTLNNINVGDGRGAWRQWDLLDHEGPIIDLEHLGYPERHRSYLPKSLLIALYERFKEDNPSGVKLGQFNEVNTIAIEIYGQEETSRLFNERKILVTIDIEGFDEKYKYLTPYLPELLDQTVIERLAKDPWLDRRLLGYAESLGTEKSGISPNLWVDRASRWSPEWRAYCDRLMQQNKQYKPFE